MEFPNAKHYFIDNVHGIVEDRFLVIVFLLVVAIELSAEAEFARRWLNIEGWEQICATILFHVAVRLIALIIAAAMWFIVGFIYVGANVYSFWFKNMCRVLLDYKTLLFSSVPQECVWVRFSRTRNMGEKGKFIRKDYLRLGFFHGIPSELSFGLDYYDELCRDEGCIRAQIAAVCLCDIKYVDKNGFFFLYRLTYPDGSTQLHDGMTYDFAEGHVKYCFTERRHKRQRWFHLAEDEFLSGLRIRRTKNTLCGITFVTSKQREFSSQRNEEIFFHNPDGMEYDTMMVNPARTHIVAFCLTYNQEGECDHIGFCAKRMKWGVCASLILLRELNIRGRAKIDPLKEDDCNNLVQRIVLLDDDLFRHVLNFLS